MPWLHTPAPVARHTRYRHIAGSAAFYDARMSETGPSTDWQTLADFAAEMGWAYKTARNRHHEANRNRANGTVGPRDMPEPDHHIGRTPLWKPTTISAYKKSRPGQGAGGGPKPRQR